MHNGLLCLVIIVLLTGCQAVSVLSDRLNNKALPDNDEGEVSISELSGKLTSSTDDSSKKENTLNYDKPHSYERIDQTLDSPPENENPRFIAAKNSSGASKVIGKTKKLKVFKKTNSEQKDVLAEIEKTESKLLLNNDVLVEEQVVSSSKKHSVKVGLLVPLTGILASEGETLLDAAQLALFESADENFVLKPYDTQGTPEGALIAAKNLINGGVSLILGPLLSEEVRILIPVVRSSGVNLVAFSTDTKVAGDGVYLLGYTSHQQVERITRFAYESGLKRFGILAPRSAYGHAIANQTRSVVSKLGAEFTNVAFYEKDISDAEEVVRLFADYERRKNNLEKKRASLNKRQNEISKRALRRLEGLDTLGEVPYDALVLPEGGKNLRQLVSLLSYYDVDPAKVRFLGTGLWDNEEIIGDPMLIGGWYVGPPPEAGESFFQRFKEIYGYAPNRRATLAYDATALAVILSETLSNSPFTRDNLTNSRGFLGVGGIFRFSSDGLPERGLAVMEIRGSNHIKVISPPPTSFPSSSIKN